MSRGKDFPFAEASGGVERDGRREHRRPYAESGHRAFLGRTTITGHSA